MSSLFYNERQYARDQRKVTFLCIIGVSMAVIGVVVCRIAGLQNDLHNITSPIAQAGVAIIALALIVLGVSFVFELSIRRRVRGQ